MSSTRYRSSHKSRATIGKSRRRKARLAISVILLFFLSIAIGIIVIIMSTPF
ncbi:MAG: hypothetical protein ACFFE4_02685 [Candidatus Thorarchaeota archaeon]